MILGATADGTKEGVAIADGCRESEPSWKDLLLSMKARGLEEGPKLAAGDGALGFWKALLRSFICSGIQVELRGSLTQGNRLKGD